MQLTLKYSLPFVSVTLVCRQAEIEVPHVLVDTGSARTMLAADVVAQVGLIPEPDDTLLTVRGVGGAEVVFMRTVDRLQVGGQAVEQLEIEIGGMDYGFEINGILGMDFLTSTGAIINLHKLQLEFPIVDGARS
jgi:predicted aspartyl protease